MYLSVSQVRRERTVAMHHQRRRGHRWAGRRKRKGHRPSIVRKRLSDKRKKIPLDEMKKGCTHMEREEDLRYRCLSRPQIKLQGHLRRQPQKELAGGVGYAHQKVENPDSTWGQQPNQTQEPYNQQGKVRPLRVGSKRLGRLRLGLSDEMVNNNFRPIQSPEVDTVYRGARVCWMVFVIRSGSIHQLKHHPNNKIRVYHYRFWILSSNIYNGISDFKRMDNVLRWINVAF
jgi:hypothetical protein